MAKVKICGLCRDEDIEAVNRYLPDYAGFMFAPSSRQLVPGSARHLIANMNPNILSVGVFVDERVEEIAEIVPYCGLDAVQLHGTEDNDTISKLRALLPTGMLIIKAIRVRNASSLEKAKEFDCDLLLLDAFAPKQAGGTGSQFDWQLLKNFKIPYLLAGGLHAENITEALGLVSPYGVDVSSGVETDGHKDEAKIAQFIDLARRDSK